jgi:mannose-6-phosphate isomerase-like protein (cupin superfamily)
VTASYPYTIQNGFGEEITFLGVAPTEHGPRLEMSGRTQPGAGPLMHVHYLQEEAITVVAGTMGFHREGEKPGQIGSGQTVVFPPGVAHRWWNAGTDELTSTGWLRPPCHSEYFLRALFGSMVRAGRKRPALFDLAFLMTRYRSEIGATDVPLVAQRIGFPIVLTVGRLLGKHHRFNDAP